MTKDFEIKFLQLKLKCAQEAVTFWSEKEKKERADPQFSGKIEHGYLHALKRYRKVAQSDVEYFSEKLKGLG